MSVYSSKPIPLNYVYTGVCASLRGWEGLGRNSTPNTPFECPINLVTGSVLLRLPILALRPGRLNLTCPDDPFPPQSSAMYEKILLHVCTVSSCSCAKKRPSKSALGDRADGPSIHPSIHP